MFENYRLLKLLGGESVFGELIKRNSHEYVLRNPIRLLELLTSEGGEVQFAPWIPFTDEQDIGINAALVVSAVSLSEEFIEEHLIEKEEEQQVDLETEDPAPGTRRYCYHPSTAESV